jgi:hypothetical protein
MQGHSRALQAILEDEDWRPKSDGTEEEENQGSAGLAD